MSRRCGRQIETDGGIWSTVDLSSIRAAPQESNILSPCVYIRREGYRCQGAVCIRRGRRDVEDSKCELDSSPRY